MDVSNSTGQNTGYRVVGAGGNMCEPAESELKPWQTEECQFHFPFLVQFFIGGEEVASATFRKDPGVVSLYEDEWGLRVRPGNGSTGEIPR